MPDKKVRTWLQDELYPWVQAVTDQLNGDVQARDGGGPIVVPPPPPPPPPSEPDT
jgi:hypothetical protein